MAGWLGVWTTDGSRPDETRWRSSVRTAGRHGGANQERVDDCHALCVWRRQSGEFPYSGTISATQGAHTA